MKVLIPIAVIAVLFASCGGQSATNKAHSLRERAAKSSKDRETACPSFDASGNPSEEGAGYFDIRTRGVSCSQVKRWALASQGGQSFDVVKSAGFTCRATEEEDAGKHYRCSVGSRAAFEFGYGS